MNEDRLHSESGVRNTVGLRMFRAAGVLVALLLTIGNLRASEFRWMRATFYCPCRMCCGEHACGLTATGRTAVGAIVAVDPRSIPLGSMVHVPGFGWMLACDKGKKIKGPNRLDVLKPTHAEAIEASGPKGYLWLRVEITTWSDYQRRLEDALFQLRFDELVRAGQRLVASTPTFTGARCGAAVSNPPPEASGARPVIQP